MIWIFLLVVLLGALLLKMGAYSVWITVFSVGLKLMFFAFFAIGIIFSVRWFVKNRKGTWMAEKFGRSVETRDS